METCIREFTSGEYKEGIVKRTFANNAYYEGEFSNKVRHGKGIFHYENGDVYFGDWVEDKIDGEGNYFY